MNAEFLLFEVITSTESLKEFIGKISDASWVALDTEFLREKTYAAKLCLIQIEADGHRACVDPLSIEDLSPLSVIMDDAKITKVFHAAHQDLEILMQVLGKIPAPIFDTQTAASVLGLGDQMGYARLVEQMLNVSLSKTQSRTDWTRRPLKQAQLEYAIDDVRYLAQIYPRMMEKLNSQDRFKWLEKDYAKAVDEETYAINARERWKKVRGNQVLKRPQLAVLRELAAWREEKAEKSDRPRKWILSDDILLDLAKQQPLTVKDIADVRGIHSGSSKNHETWVNLIKTGKDLPEADWPELPRSNKPTATQNVVIDLLMLVLQMQAKKHGITPAAIATRKQVATMIQAKETRLSEDWRGELVNESFADVLAGKLVVGVDNGKASLIEK